MDNKPETELEQAHPLDTIPEFKPDSYLAEHTFLQQGEILICMDDPTITAKLPLGVKLVGEPGNYRLEKLF